MHVTLAYDVEIGLQDPTAEAVKVAVIPVDQEFVFLHMNKTSDVTVAATGKVTRTIVLETDADSDVMFPTAAELVAATRALLSGVLGLATPGRVTAATPVVTP
jgi:hypothetical protein